MQNEPTIPLPSVEPEQEIEYFIHKYLCILDEHNHLSPDTRSKMAKHLHLFIKMMTLKFIVGQIEHGGNFFEPGRVNGRKELEKELIDLFWYLSIL